MNDSRALKIRVLKYLIPVTVICIVFNITKFFEITVVYVPIAKNTTSELNNATNYSNFSSIISEGGSFPEEEVFPLENVSFVSPKGTFINRMDTFPIQTIFDEFRPLLLEPLQKHFFKTVLDFPLNNFRSFHDF